MGRLPAARRAAESGTAPRPARCPPRPRITSPNQRGDPADHDAFTHSNPDISRFSNDQYGQTTFSAVGKTSFHARSILRWRLLPCGVYDKQARHCAHIFGINRNIISSDNHFSWAADASLQVELGVSAWFGDLALDLVIQLLGGRGIVFRDVIDNC